MNPRSLCGLLLVSLLCAVLVVPPLDASTYGELEDRLESGKSVPGSFLDQLPPASTARQFWLRSRARTSRSAALKDLRQAVRRSESPEWRRTYFLDWLEIALLEPGDAPDLAFVNDTLRGTDATGDDGRLWLLAGRLAHRQDRLEWAQNWFESAARDESVRGRAWLSLARVHLERKNPDRARHYLERFLVHYPSSSRPEYWLLRGRMYEQVGSDSEAYVAYSHVVNQYPESPLLARAEQRLEGLSLPGALYPRSGGSSPKSSEPEGTESASSPPAEDRYRIQIGSFLERERASAYRDRMRGRFDRALAIQPARIEGRRYYRVQVTGFAGKADAERRLEELKDRGMDGFVVRGEQP